jgi:hypothetical protein
VKFIPLCGSMYVVATPSRTRYFRSTLHRREMAVLHRSHQGSWTSSRSQGLLQRQHYHPSVCNPITCSNRASSIWKRWCFARAPS